MMDYTQRINETEYLALSVKLRQFYVKEVMPVWRDGELIAMYSWRIPENMTLTKAGEIFREEQARAEKKPYSWDGLNPWLGATFNLTKQGKILQKAPELAERLRHEAYLAGDIPR